MTRVAVIGATGRMGQEVLAAASDRETVSVVLAVGREAGESVHGSQVEDVADLRRLLGAQEPDVIIDFTTPDASVEAVEIAAEAGVPAVVGTTGFDDEQHDRLRAASERIPVLVAANFSRGIQALLAAVREATTRLPGYDVEITETHHNRKRDAPSGTATVLVEAIEAVRGESQRVHGREGDTPREDGEIAIHARRAGDITGEHEVLLAGNHESVHLTHRAGNRGVFAEGALDAAVWLANRDPGWYEFSDVVTNNTTEPNRGGGLA